MNRQNTPAAEGQWVKAQPREHFAQIQATDLYCKAQAIQAAFDWLDEVPADSAEADRTVAKAGAWAVRSLRKAKAKEDADAIRQLEHFGDLVACYWAYHAGKVRVRCIEPKAADNSGNGRQEQRDEGSEKPSDMITSSVAIATYQLSRTTLRRAAKEGRLADYRPPGHAPNAPLVVSEAEVAAIWNKRPGATQRP